MPKTKEMLRREAAAWLARLQSGRDPDSDQKFRRWYDADPRHASAFDRVRGSYELAALLKRSKAGSPRSAIPARRKPGLQPRYALAAAAALAVLLPAGLLLFRGDGLPLGSTNVLMLMTQVGEIRQVRLPDGSNITLDTSTKVEVDISRSHRRAYLKYGRARFEVVPASAPFAVQAGSTTLSTPQGVFDVENVGEQERVQLFAGTAEVRRSARKEADPLILGAGESVLMNSAAPGQKQRATTSADWIYGMLQFDRTPLVDAVGLANRYSDRHIILSGNLDQLRVTGGFRAGDTAGLARALAAALRLSLKQRADGNLILSPTDPPLRRNKEGG